MATSWCVVSKVKEIIDCLEFVWFTLAGFKSMISDLVVYRGFYNSLRIDAREGLIRIVLVAHHFFGFDSERVSIRRAALDGAVNNHPNL